jgi:FHA domain
MDHPENRVALIELLGRDGRVQHTVDVVRWPVTLGRSLANTVVLDDPQVAAQHATLLIDEQGRVCLQVGPSINGVQWSLPGPRHGRHHAGAGSHLRLPGPGTVLALGGQRLRLRLPSDAIEAERPLVGLARAGRSLAVVAGLWFAVQALQRWIDLDPGADFTQWLPWVLGLPIGLAGWCGLWALGSKVFRHGFDFFGHAAVALPILLAIEAIDNLLPAAAASLGWPLLWQLQKLLLPPLLIGWLLRSHVRQLLPLRGRTIDVVLLALIGTGLMVGVAVNLRQQGRVFADPYMRTLPMPALQGVTPLPTAQLEQAMLPLRTRLADRVRQAAADEPADAIDNPP